MARGRVFLDDIGTGYVRGHQVGSELDAFESQAERFGERPDQQCLGGPGHARDQAMAADEQRDQQGFDDVMLADDDLADLLTQARRRFPEGVDEFAHLVRIKDCFCFIVSHAVYPS